MCVIVFDNDFSGKLVEPLMFGLASLFVYFSWKIVNVRNFNQGQPSAGRALFQKR